MLKTSNLNFLIQNFVLAKKVHRRVNYLFILRLVGTLFCNIVVGTCGLFDMREKN